VLVSGVRASLSSYIPLVSQDGLAMSKLWGARWRKRGDMRSVLWLVHMQIPVSQKLVHPITTVFSPKSLSKIEFDPCNGVQYTVWPFTQVHASLIDLAGFRTDLTIQISVNLGAICGLMPSFQGQGRSIQDGCTDAIFQSSG
jgi:hypothetical protein